MYSKSPFTVIFCHHVFFLNRNSSLPKLKHKRRSHHSRARFQNWSESFQLNRPPWQKEKDFSFFSYYTRNYYRDLNGLLYTLKNCIICSSLPQNECCWRIKYESNRWRMDLQERLMLKNVELFQNWWPLPSSYQTNRVQTHFSRL